VNGTPPPAQPSGRPGSPPGYGPWPGHAAPPGHGAQPGYGAARPAFGAPPGGVPAYGAAPAGYPQPGHAQPGYPQPGYAPPGYPQPGLGGSSAGAGYADWGRRVLALLIDGAIPAAVVLLVVLPLTVIGDLALLLTVGGVAYLAVFAFAIWNSGYRQGTTGQSIGKKVIGIRLVRAQDRQPVGFGPAVGRQLLHVVDAIPFYLGYLWPLWDDRKQTFADKICDTVVVPADR
jgi:uncharacterized RDD family membrane protein YckC